MSLNHHVFLEDIAVAGRCRQVLGVFRAVSSPRKRISKLGCPVPQRSVAASRQLTQSMPPAAIVI